MRRYAVYPSLEDRTVFITGGASGIGAAMVEAFAGQGSRVGFVDIDTEAGEALAGRLGGSVAFVPCDLRDIGQLRDSFGALKARLGPAAVLVNNAARDDRHTGARCARRYWDERMATNLSPLLLRHPDCWPPDRSVWAAVPSINYGSISDAARRGGPMSRPVHHAKSAVSGLTRTMSAGPRRAPHPREHARRRVLVMYGSPAEGLWAHRGGRFEKLRAKRQCLKAFRAAASTMRAPHSVCVSDELAVHVARAGLHVREKQRALI